MSDLLDDAEKYFGEKTVGCATVPCPLSSNVQAEATRKPSDSEVQEIQNDLNDGNYQAAINKTKQYYGIDTSNVPNNVQYDPTELDYGAADFDGNINLGSAAMNTPEELATTIVHETTHANQAARIRAANPTLTDWPSGADDIDYDEAIAYDSELRSAQNTRLIDNESALNMVVDRRADHLNALPETEQEKFNNGVYPR